MNEESPHRAPHLLICDPSNPDGAVVSCEEVARVADQLELLGRANDVIIAKLQELADPRRSPSQATITAVELLVRELRPPAALWDVLAELDDALLLAGYRRERQHRRSGGGR